MPVTAYLGLGSNIGDRISNIKDAINRLDKSDGICMKKASSLYETEPVGYVDQPDFINCVVEIETELDPYQLLDVVQNIEKKMGRTRNLRWGPRIIDIDILLFDDIKVKTDVLEIPHPRMMERSFVMVPLSEIASEIVLRKTGAAEYNRIVDGKTIRKL